MRCSGLNSGAICAQWDSAGAAQQEIVAAMTAPLDVRHVAPSPDVQSRPTDDPDSRETIEVPPPDAYVYMVLLVDDQAIVGEAVRRMLASEPDVDLHYCGNPEDGVGLAERLRPTVILQDLIMPGVDGLTLVRRYRANAATKDIPIIVLSTREDPAVKREAFTAGANDYLVKLPDKIELIARVRLHSKAYLNQRQRDDAYRALRESQRQLTASNAALRSLNKELEKATNVKSAFLASMSHEIRTPMNGVIGMTTLLLDTPLTADQLDFVEMIRRCGNTLLTIINDILDLSKIESGSIDLEAAPFHVRQCLEDAMQLLAHAAADKALDFVLLMDPAVPALIVGDVTRLRQVLINLIGNAVKFTEHGEVVVSAGVEASADPAAIRLHIAVTDTGIGIPADKLDRLFRPFGQADSSTTRRFGGTGLGLVISRHLAQIMGGDIQLESALQNGSTFHVRVTMARGPDEVPLWTHGAPALRGKRVLMVDDCDAQRRALGQFARVWGLAFTDTDSVAAAETIISEAAAPYDVMLVDQQLLDGKAAFTNTLCASAAAAGAAVLLLSPTRTSHADLIRLGATGCIVTPLRPALLLEAMVTALDGDVPEVGPALSDSSVDATLADRLPLRLLLADDNVVNQKVGTHLLQRLGYSVDVVANGAEVLRALETHRYDLIFLDLQMPEMDGCEAARRVRSSWPTDALPCPRLIAMTSSVSELDRARCLEAGMDDYISKPFTMDRLRDALERWGSGSPGPAET